MVFVKKISFSLSVISIISILLLFSSISAEEKSDVYNNKDFIIENGKIISYVGNDTIINIPEYIDGQIIIEISDNTFKNNDKVEKIYIPDTITTIGNNAFENCINLKSIDLSSNLTGCGAYAFSGCLSLESIVIPGKLKVIGPETGDGYVFNNCTSLKTVVISEGVENLGTYTFYKCKSLENIYLPDSLNRIGVWDFGYCESIVNIEIPQNVQNIESAAFYSCKSLNKIVIPNSVVNLGTHLFRDCLNLKEVILSEKITSIPYRAFSNCKNLNSIVLPNSVVTVEDEAFYLSGIKSIELSNSLDTIGKRAFYMCENIGEIIFSDSITLIDDEAFYGCKKLNFANLPKNLREIGNSSFYNCYSIEEIVLNDNIESIGSQAFYGCNKIIAIVLPASLQSIGDSAFGECNKLTEVINLSSLDIVLGSEENGSVALNALCVHSSIDTETHIFEDDMGLVFYYNDTTCLLLNYVGENKEVVLPYKFDKYNYKINRYAFAYNNTIESVIIPDNIYEITEGAFYSCSNLSIISFSKNINLIEKNAFYGCKHLHNIVFDGNRDDWNSINIFDGNSSLSKYYVSFIDETNNEILIDHIKTESISSFLMKNIFFINFLVTLLLGMILIYSSEYNKTSEQTRKNRKLFIVLVCLQWILISGLRDLSVGADTQNYANLFNEHLNLSWRQIIHELIIYITNGGEYSLEYEPGYILFEKIIGSFTTNPIIYNFIIALIFMSAFGYYVYKNSIDPCLSFIIYDALFYNMFSLTGYRQTIAVAIAVLFGSEFIKKRKLIPFLILVLVACLFHKTTLIFLLLYFLANKKIKFNYIIFSAFVIFIGVLYRNQIFYYVKNIFGYEQYAGNYGFAQGTFTLFLILLTIVAFIQYRNVIDNYKYANIYYNGFILMWYMMPLAMVSPTSMRLVYIFGFVLIPFVPALIKSFSDIQTRRIIYLLIYLLFAYFIAVKTPEYQFFWI